jgi:hypothetical protein
MVDLGYRNGFRRPIRGLNPAAAVISGNPAKAGSVKIRVYDLTPALS